MTTPHVTPRPRAAAGKPSELGNGYAVQVLDRVFSILDLLAERRAGVAEISAALQLHRATVFRLLANLSQRGYVRRDDSTGTFSLGMQLFRLGTKALEEQFPVRRLRPLLETLAAVSTQTAQLWLRSGQEAVCVDQVESPVDLRVVGRVGRRLALNAGAVGKVLLAFAASELAAEFLAAPLRRGGVDRDRLPAELARIRARGWAQSETHLRIRSWAIAAPVYNAVGAVELCVCILVVDADGPTTNAEELRRHVVDTAARMSQVLGFVASPR